MVCRQFPAIAIRRGFESMSDPDMPPQHHAAITAIEAHHIVPLHRALDRNRRRSRLLGRCDAPETAERSMHLGDEPGELIAADLVMPHIAADNARDETRIDPGATT